MLADSRADLTLTAVPPAYPPHDSAMAAFLPPYRVRGLPTTTTTPAASPPFFLPSSHHVQSAFCPGEAGLVERTSLHAFQAFSRACQHMATLHGDAFRAEDRLSSLLRLQANPGPKLLMKEEEEDRLARLLRLQANPGAKLLLKEEEEDRLARLQFLARPSVAGAGRTLVHYRAEDYPYSHRHFPHYHHPSRHGEGVRNPLCEPNVLDTVRFSCGTSTGDSFLKRRTTTAVADLNKDLPHLGNGPRWRRLDQDPFPQPRVPRHPRPGVDWRRHDGEGEPGRDSECNSSRRGKPPFAGEHLDDHTTKAVGSEKESLSSLLSQPPPLSVTTSGCSELTKRALSPEETPTNAQEPCLKPGGKNRDHGSSQKLKRIQKRRDKLLGQKKPSPRGSVSGTSTGQARAKKPRPSPRKDHTDTRDNVHQRTASPAVDGAATPDPDSVLQGAEARKTFQCSQCRYVTDRKNNLKRHVVTMHHRTSRVLECCGALFHSKASLRDHVSLYHRGGYRCQVCSRNFCRKALLRRHLTVHSGQKDFTCHLCAYATSHKSNLERHQRVHVRKSSALLAAPSRPEALLSPSDPNRDADRSAGSPRPAGSEPAGYGGTERTPEVVRGSRGKGEGQTVSVSSSSPGEEDQDQSAGETSDDAQDTCPTVHEGRTTVLELEELGTSSQTIPAWTDSSSYHSIPSGAFLATEMARKSLTETVASSDIRIPSINAIPCSSDDPVNQGLCGTAERAKRAGTESLQGHLAVKDCWQDCDSDTPMPTSRETSHNDSCDVGRPPVLTVLQNCSESETASSHCAGEFGSRRTAQLRRVCFPNRLKETYAASDTTTDAVASGSQDSAVTDGVDMLEPGDHQTLPDSRDDYDEKENGRINDNVRRVSSEKYVDASSKKSPVSCPEVCKIQNCSDRFGNDRNENKIKPRMCSRPYRCFGCGASFAHQGALLGHVCRDDGQDELLAFPLSSSVRRGCIKLSLGHGNI